MAIMFGCPECGKQLKVGDGMAGKTCKCPGCATLIQIPSESLEAKEELAVVEADGGGDADRPRRRREDGERPPPRDDDAIRPSDRKRPREGSNLALWFGIAGTIGGMLIAGIVGAYFYYFTKSGLGEEMDYLPDHPLTIRSVNLD